MLFLQFLELSFNGIQSTHTPAFSMVFQNDLWPFLGKYYLQFRVFSNYSRRKFLQNLSRHSDMD